MSLLALKNDNRALSKKDVLGSPSIPYSYESIGKGASIDRGPMYTQADLIQLLTEADDEFMKVATHYGMTPDRVSSEVVEKWADMGLPTQRFMSGSGRGPGQTVERFREELTKMGMSADLAKEITLSGIGNWTTDQGPWLYDLEGPSKKVFPVLTPIRNKIPRIKGRGTSKRFRRIDGITGSQTGGIANTRISFNESVSTTVRGLALNRPKNISYATSLGNINYKLEGFSDDLTWTSQYASEGFEDLRALIALNLLRAHMMGEEQELLSGRVTAISTPSAPTLSQRAPATGESAISGAGTNVYVKITAVGHYGETPVSAVASIALTGGNVIDVTVSNAFVAGAHGFDVYVGTGSSQPTDANFFQASWNAGAAVGQDYSGGNVFTISGALPTTGDTAANHTTDTTASADDYDGMMTITAASGGVAMRLNGTLTLDAIQKQLFLPMFTSYKADPDEIWCYALESIRITDLVLGASGTPYRVVVDMNAQQDVTGTYRVSRLVNKVTGKEVAVTVHPYIEQGNLLAVSYELPFPNSEVPNVWAKAMVQDYLQVDWPVIQMSYDSSTYGFGALIPYAPAYNGIIQGIQPS